MREKKRFFYNFVPLTIRPQIST